MDDFRSTFGRNIYQNKYALYRGQSWEEKSRDVVSGVARGLVNTCEANQMEQDLVAMKWLPGGRYLYYAGRPLNFWNNCLLLRLERDDRQAWGELLHRASDALMSGAGIGVDYSIARPKGAFLARTGGTASGPIPLMKSVNEIGRNVMQGGSRRSAIYASLNWQHGDIDEFLRAKDWHDISIGEGRTLSHLKMEDFNAHAPLDMTNISLNYDDDFLTYKDALPPTFIKNVEKALKSGEPGFSFNFGEQQNETLRNACCEVTSEDDSDICNLASINMSRVDSIDEFREIVGRTAEFLVCGSIRADVPYDKVLDVRTKNRRLGLGLMGLHEWLLKRGYGYEVVPELREWLAVYRDESERAARHLCDRLSVSHPIAFRSIAPTGTIGIIAGTTTGIEPVFATAYKRRYLVGATDWHYEYVIDATAKVIVEHTGVEPDSIETASSLAEFPEQRIKFQADIQDYVDMAISSTINLPTYGSTLNNPDTVRPFAETLAAYAPRLRGLTVYPDGARGGQPLNTVPYAEAVGNEGVVFKDHDSCKGGVCGI